jgi:deoxyinosine 3'endonuclease (endonuclease V)
MKRQDGTYIPAVVPQEWQTEQTFLAKQVLQTNNLTFSATKPFSGLKYIAGVDISFVKGSTKACAMLSILDFPNLNLVHQTYDIVEMTEEYIPFYLAFREVRHLVVLFERIKREKPEIYPQVIFVDGGGVWHPKGLGLASHLGVLVSIPTIGIAKSLLYLPDIPTTQTYETIRSSIPVETGFVRVLGESGKCYGAGVIPRHAIKVEKPIFVSVGHMIELETAVELVHESSKYRIPEAIRAADGGSREILRDLKDMEEKQQQERERKGKEKETKKEEEQEQVLD